MLLWINLYVCLLINLKNVFDRFFVLFLSLLKLKGLKFGSKFGLILFKYFL